jgi:virulence factor Mce-like protein
MRAEVLLPGTGRYVSRRLSTLLGLIMVVLLVGSAVLVLESFEGTFTNEVAVEAILPEGANAPQVQSPVEYRDVTVGQVASNGHPIGGGRVSIKLYLKPSMLASIPETVQATVGPLSIFGNQYVDLEAGHGVGGAALRAGQTIGAITHAPNASLQSTIASFYDVLSAIHPAQLQATFSALANALAGQGKSLGDTLSEASSYLKTMIPLLPTFETDLQLLTPVASDIGAATPALLGILSNLTLTSGTIVNEQVPLHDLLTGGATVAGQGTQLLDAIAQPYEHLLTDSGPLLADLSNDGQNQQDLAQILAGLDGWSKSWVAAESQGPYLTLTSSIAVTNAADLVLASLGSPNSASLFTGGLGASLVNPAPYTAADCPTYGTEGGTDCGGSASTAAQVAASSTAKVLPEPAQTDAVSSIVTGLDHGRAPASPAVDTLLLGPVLAQMVRS